MLALKLNMYRPVLESDEERFRNDEREEQQRDRAHYLAYEFAGACARDSSLNRAPVACTPTMMQLWLSTR